MAHGPVLWNEALTYSLDVMRMDLIQHATVEATDKCTSIRRAYGSVTHAYAYVTSFLPLFWLLLDIFFSFRSRAIS